VPLLLGIIPELFIFCTNVFQISFMPLLLPMPTHIANCCFRIGGCPVLWPAWHSCLFIKLQHWKTQTGLGPWADWEAWPQACTHSWHLGMGCSQLGHLGLALSALFSEVLLSMPHHFEMFWSFALSCSTSTCFPLKLLHITARRLSEPASYPNCQCRSGGVIGTVYERHTGPLARYGVMISVRKLRV